MPLPNRKGPHLVAVQHRGQRCGVPVAVLPARLRPLALLRRQQGAQVGRSHVAPRLGQRGRHLARGNLWERDPRPLRMVECVCSTIWLGQVGGRHVAPGLGQGSGHLARGKLRGTRGTGEIRLERFPAALRARTCGDAQDAHTFPQFQRCHPGYSPHRAPTRPVQHFASKPPPTMQSEAKPVATSSRSPALPALI